MGRLSRLLRGWRATYQDVDETGGLHVPQWRLPGCGLLLQPQDGAELVGGVLAPGCRLGEFGGGSMALVHRFGEEGAGLTRSEAAQWGWLEVAG